MKLRVDRGEIIIVLAALTAAPRWVTSLMPADAARFVSGEEPWWQLISGVSAVAFALVETYASAFLMRAWRRARGDVERRTLLAFWVFALVALVIVMAPAVYANARREPFEALPAWLHALWSIAVVASSFAIIGGIGFAERVNEEETAVALEADQSATGNRQFAETDQPYALNEGHRLPSVVVGSMTSDEEARAALTCECGYVAKSKPALNGHRQSHRKNASLPLVEAREAA